MIAKVKFAIPWKAWALTWKRIKNWFNSVLKSGHFLGAAFRVYIQPAHKQLAERSKNYQFQRI